MKRIIKIIMLAALFILPSFVVVSSLGPHEEHWALLGQKWGKLGLKDITKMAAHHGVLM